MLTTSPKIRRSRILHGLLFFSLNRKFADIEAANHRLASALYFKEEDKNAPSVQPEKPEVSVQSDNASQMSPPQHPEKCSLQRAADGVSKPANDALVGSHQSEASEKYQLWKRHSKSHSTTCTTRRNNMSTGRQKRGNGKPTLVEFTFMDSPKDKDYRSEAAAFQTEPYEDDSQVKPPRSLSEAQTALPDSGFIQSRDMSPSFSPALSLLSIDSCDFSIQMFTDISACTQSQKSIADIAESQWADIMDLFSSGNSDKEGCVDAESCLCQGDAGQDVSADELPFSDQSDGLCNNTCESEDLCCETGEYNAFSCQRDQSTHHPGQTPFNNFTPAQSSDISNNYQYDVSELQTYQNPQEGNHCLLGGCDYHLHFTPFEGVAQSFSAPLHNPEHRVVPTPPRDDDWLFTDILKDAGELAGC